MDLFLELFWFDTEKFPTFSRSFSVSRRTVGRFIFERKGTNFGSVGKSWIVFWFWKKIFKIDVRFKIRFLSRFCSSIFFELERRKVRRKSSSSFDRRFSFRFVSIEFKSFDRIFFCSNFVQSDSSNDRQKSFSTRMFKFFFRRKSRRNFLLRFARWISLRFQCSPRSTFVAV